MTVNDYKELWGHEEELTSFPFMTTAAELSKNPVSWDEVQETYTNILEEDEE
jgi:hypothetical protein